MPVPSVTPAVSDQDSTPRIRVLMTGSRNLSAVVHGPVVHDALVWAAQMTAAIRGLHTNTSVSVTLVHGAARGADTVAADAATSLGWTVEAHPANWRPNGVFDRSAGHRRNHEMIAAGADIVIGFPLGEARGTRGCLTAAAKAGLPTWSVDLSSAGIIYYLSTGDILGDRVTA